MKDVGLLMDGIYQAYRLAFDYDARHRHVYEGPFLPTVDDKGVWLTHCNEAVNFVAKKFGYNAFDYSSQVRPHGALSADQMYALMRDPVGAWRALPDAVAAQAAANAGNLVVAAFINPNGHGHVAIVVPGVLELSPSYGYVVPRIFNVGEDVFLGKRASFGFSKAEAPTYFTLKETAEVAP